MSIILRPVRKTDKAAVMAVFNYFVQHSFAAYPEYPVADEFFDRMRGLAGGYPFLVAENEAGDVVGFGLLRNFHPAPTFRQAGELTYFIMPECTGKGVGSQMLQEFVRAARESGMTTLLASISSLNEQSIRFHKKHGFRECGRFECVGFKHGREFDMVWMQKFLDKEIP
ncbi:MAG: GNAT family N-acetyltransferase [candidate division Zixibacteria bacterium]|nr:GNAT family N-acetyltransferase [candidate division Zixibacteria bacterium]